jgi:hypothetical protein
MYDDDKTRVLLVVGGALTGLFSAVFFWRIVCRASSSSNATPICSYILSAVHGINLHTVELFRQVGLEPAIRGRQVM